MMEEVLGGELVSPHNSTIGLLEFVKYFKEMSLINNPK